ncbi:hypothetical protein ACIPSA_47640 [Streptomyces sp. NPDC086549]|uniref:hypothetical protein n=1 Tax=Streptomyces sp. NPDC086549 TaxID=3365752 RepID=UPI00380616AA
MDFFIGEITRDHVDIDWFAWTDDASALTDGLLRSGTTRCPGRLPTSSSISASTGWRAVSPSWTRTGRGASWSLADPGPGRYGRKACSMLLLAVSGRCDAGSSVPAPRSRSSR